MPLLQTAGFTSFILWLFQFPRVALADSTTVYSNALLFFAPFVAAFTVFALLARARKLPLIHVTTAFTSLVAVVLGFYFALSPSPAARMGCLVALTVLAAYFLVSWGGVLRTLCLKAAIGLVFGAIGIAGALQLCLALIALATGMTNMHTYYLSILALLSLMPLVSGLYFFKTRTDRSAKQGFSKSSTSWNPDISWRSNAFLPLVVILLVGSVLIHFASGYTYSPFMFNGIFVDCLRAVVEILVAAFTLLLLRLRSAPASPAAVAAAGAAAAHTSPVSTSAAFGIKHAFILVLGLTIGGVALLLLGQTGVFYAQGILAALGDLYCCFAIVFCVSPSDSGRGAFFTRFLVALLGSGYLWAYGLGAFTQSLFGYDHQLILLFAVFILVVLTLLLLFAATKAGTGDTGPAVLDETVGATSTKAPATTGEHFRDNLLPYNLTEREVQIALLIVQRHTAVTAGVELGISQNTVKFHLGNVYRKCGVSNRAGLVALIRQGHEDD